MEALKNDDWGKHDREMRYAKCYQEAADGGPIIIKHKPPLDKHKKTAKKDTTTKKDNKKVQKKDKGNTTIVADYIPAWQRQ